MLSLNQRHEMGNGHDLWSIAHCTVRLLKKTNNKMCWYLFKDPYNQIAWTMYDVLRPLNPKLHQNLIKSCAFNSWIRPKVLSKRCTMREKNFATIYITKRALSDYLYVSSREVWKLFWACLIALSTRLLAALKRQNPNDIIESHLSLSVSTLNPKRHSYFWIHMIN